jgi:hypothetical protein
MVEQRNGPLVNSTGRFAVLTRTWSSPRHCTEEPPQRRYRLEDCTSHAIRNPSYFQRMDPLARPYFLKDSARVAAFHGMKFRRPIPDPINQDPVSLAVAEDQPLARRLGRLGVAATERGHGLEFCQEVSELLLDGSVSGWDQGTHLADAAARAGHMFKYVDRTLRDQSRVIV